MAARGQKNTPVPKPEILLWDGCFIISHSRYHSNCGYKHSATSSKSDNFYALTQHTRETPTGCILPCGKSLWGFRLRRDKKSTVIYRDRTVPDSLWKSLVASVFINAFVFKFEKTFSKNSSERVLFFSPFYYIILFSISQVDSFDDNHLIFRWIGGA